MKRCITHEGIAKIVETMSNEGYGGHLGRHLGLRALCKKFQRLSTQMLLLRVSAFQKCTTTFYSSRSDWHENQGSGPLGIPTNVVIKSCLLVRNARICLCVQFQPWSILKKPDHRTRITKFQTYEFCEIIILKIKIQIILYRGKNFSLIFSENRMSIDVAVKELEQQQNSGFCFRYMMIEY